MQQQLRRWRQGRRQVFRDIGGSRWSDCRFTAATPNPPITHPKSSDLHESHGCPLRGWGVRTPGSRARRRPWLEQKASSRRTEVQSVDNSDRRHIESGLC